MAELERLLIGRTLSGRYEVREVIGRGGMSVVFRATDHRLQRPVALKLISLGPGAGEVEPQELRARLRREAAGAARIASHPNVVQIFDYGTDEELDLDFIAMELLPGRDLKRVIREGGLPTAEARRVIIEAARGVAAGHRAGLLHRDVKPANIFLVGSERFEVVKVLDFGIAKPIAYEPEDDLTVDARLPHSPAYASPEQLDRTRALTAASDVYQLGLVAYELLTGERPFDGPQRERIRSGEQVPLPESERWQRVEPGVRRAIERALAGDPSARFATAEGFAAAVASATGGGAGPGEATTFRDDEDGDGTVAMAPGDTPISTIDASSPDLGTVGGLGAAGPAYPPPPAAPRDGGTPVRGRHSGSSRRRTLAVALPLAAALVLLLAGVVASRIGRASDPATIAFELPDIETLHAEFRPLLYEAFGAIRDARSHEEGEEAAAAVQDVVLDVQRTLVDGDLDAHLALYGDRADFRGRRNADLRHIERERSALIERYDRREITVSAMAIEFVEPGRARVLVNRRWRFEGDDVWEGSARDEMFIVLDGERWRVVAEREIEAFTDERARD